MKRSKVLKWFLYSAIIAVLIVSCKSRLVSGKMVSDTAFNDIKSFKKFQKYQTSLTRDFNTLIMSSDLKYKGNGSSQKLKAEIRIKKDEVIYVNLRFFGISMAKAMITPGQVKYYEKLEGTYYEGGFESLSELLGAPLDFNRLQNIIMGQPLVDINPSELLFEKQESKIRLTEKENKTISYIFEYAAPSLLMSNQKIIQQKQVREMNVFYSEIHETIDSVQVLLPMHLEIEAKQNDKLHFMSLNHGSVKVNKQITFPYRVPEGYKRINIQ